MAAASPRKTHGRFRSTATARAMPRQGNPAAAAAPAPGAERIRRHWRPDRPRIRDGRTSRGRFRRPALRRRSARCSRPDRRAETAAASWAPAPGTQKHPGLVHRSPRRGGLDDPQSPGNTALGAVRKCGSGRSLGHDRQVHSVRGCAGLPGPSDLTPTPQRRHRTGARRRHSGSTTSVQVGSTSWAGSPGRFSACSVALRRSRQDLICTIYPHFSVATNTSALAAKRR